VCNPRILKETATVTFSPHHRFKLDDFVPCRLLFSRDFSKGILFHLRYEPIVVSQSELATR
jgi:hypothetical protein